MAFCDAIHIKSNHTNADRTNHNFVFKFIMQDTLQRGFLSLYIGSLCFEFSKIYLSFKVHFLQAKVNAKFKSKHQTKHLPQVRIGFVEMDH